MTEFAAPRVAPRGLRIRRTSPVLAIAVVVVLLVVFAGAFGSLVAPRDPHAQDLSVGLSSPNSEYWFGTDDVGRDVFSRTVVGARNALVGPLLIALGAFVLGNALGLFAGYRGGVADSLIMRWVDLMYAFPGGLFVIVLVGVMGSGYFVAVAILTVLSSPYDTRIVRGAALEQRALPYVEAARTLGVPAHRIMFRHILPNILPLTLANAFLTLAFSLVALSALSFLGLGVGPGSADWGRMLAESRLLMFENPAAALAPGAAIVLTAASMNIVGDWLYERLADRGRAR